MKKPADPRHAAFVKAWCDAFLLVFGQPYVFQGGQDAMCLKRLLTALPDATVEQLVDTAKLAWPKRGSSWWNCEKAIQMSFFCTRYNLIQKELGLLRAQTKPVTSGDKW